MKICRTCGTLTDQFYRDRKNPDGFRSHCKKCEGKKKNEYFSKNPEARAFRSAKNRCENKNSKDFFRYGGMGIRFCFNHWSEIIDEIGPRPHGTSLDRINNEGNYERGNIRWATIYQQNRNRRNSLTIKQVKGILIDHRCGLTQHAIGKRYGVTQSTVFKIIHKQRWADVSLDC